MGLKHTKKPGQHVFTKKIAVKQSARMVVVGEEWIIVLRHKSGETWVVVGEEGFEEDEEWGDENNPYKGEEYSIQLV